MLFQMLSLNLLTTHDRDITVSAHILRLRQLMFYLSLIDWWEHLDELTNVNLAIMVDIEDIENLLETLFRQNPTLVDGGCLELSEVNPAVAIKIDVSETLLKLFGEAWDLTANLLKFIDIQGSILIRVKDLKLSFEGF